MKILQINAVYRRLSTGRNVMELNRFFEQHNHSCIAAFSADPVEDGRREFKIGTTADQKAHAFLSRMTGLQGYYSVAATRKLLRYIDQTGPDVVMLNNLHANYIHLPMLLKYLAKKDIPTVAVLHDCWFYTGKCCHYTVADCYRWQEHCGNCPAKKKYNKSWLFDRTQKMLRDKKEGFRRIPRLGVIAVSDWLLNEAKKAPVFSEATAMRRIYNWIDLEKFTVRDVSALREEMGLKDKKVILCVAGTWDASKGLNTVLQLQQLLQDHEHLIIVGNVPAGTVFSERVTQIPRTDNVEQLIALYNLADVFLQPSPEETFGKVSAEALACGTPVITYNSCGSPELVPDGCGIIVKENDTDAIVSAIQKSKNMVFDKCADIGKSTYDKILCYAEYLKVYSEVQKN